MIKLHYAPGTASLTPHILLRELAVPFELSLVDRSQNGQKSEPYLRLNPNGLIPTLEDGDLVVYETAAVVLHLVDRFPEGNLAPAVGTRARADFYRWIAHLSCAVQPEMRAYFYPEQHIDDPKGVADVKAVAERRLAERYERIERQLGDGPFLLGDHYTAADPYLMMLVRWGRNMNRPPRDLPNLRRHAERVLARSAVRTAFDVEGLAAPLI